MPELRGHQVGALEYLGDRAIYGDGAGTGKTATALRWAEARPGVETKRTLILASSEEILDHWLREANIWTVTRPIKGYGTARQREAARADALAHPHCFLVLNYEAAWRDVDGLIGVGFDNIICDEAHHLKNRQSATFKAVDKLARRAPNFLAVTGTPIMNRADEAWSLLHLCDPKNYTSYWRWVNFHFEVEVTDFHGTVKRPIQLVKGLRPSHEKMVKGELARYLLQRSYDDIFPGTPPARETTHTVILDDAERAHYEELVRKSWTRVGDELIITENAVAKTTRLRQLTSSWATIAADLPHPGAKIKEAVRVAVEMYPGEQVLILSAYQETARRIAAEIGEDAMAYTGDTKKPERRAILDFFKAGDLRVLSATIGTLGEGVDGLDVAHVLIQVDMDWTPARNEQILARLRRAGKTEQVRVHYIVARNTIDQAVQIALDRKDAIVASLI